MDTADDVNMGEVKKFITPDIMDIATIKTREKNARVSLKGVVEKVKKKLLNCNSYSHNPIY